MASNEGDLGAHCPDIGTAEYIAVAKLRANAFVTLDAALRKQLRGIVATVPFKTLAAASKRG